MGLIRGATWCCAICALSSPALAQEPSPVSGVLENYWATLPGVDGLGERLGWLQIEGQLNYGFGFTWTYLFLPSGEVLDETYARFDSGLTEVRFGRFRSGFGIYAWSDHFYNALIPLPLIRSAFLQPNLSLRRFDTGADIRTVLGPCELQVGLVDTSSSPWQLSPDHARHGVARLQAYVGSIILGASFVGSVANRQSQDSEAYGIDFRWTAERVQARGELVRTRGAAGWTGGYYLDVFYRPPGFHRTQIGLREQAIDSQSGAVTQAHTLGIRQAITSEVAATLNFGSATGPSSRTLKGWSFEISTSFRF